MYRTYHTEAVVLGSLPHGEANRVFMLLTPDHGFVYARAQGVRRERSKLRYSLQNFSHASVELVSGRVGWRLVNAAPRRSFLPAYDMPLHDRRKALSVMARLAGLVRRLSPGEGAHPELFRDIVEAFEMLRDAREITSTEILAAMRTLYHLGYWRESAHLPPHFVSGDIRTPELHEEVRTKKRHAIRGINEALRETHL